MSLNPNFPRLEYAVSFAASPNSSTVQDAWSDLTKRAEDRTSTQRGKTYELDQVQPGTMKFRLRNDDGALDPDNAASLYAGYVKPYRLIRFRANYPPVSNILSGDQASARYQSAGSYTGSTLPTYVKAVASATLTISNQSQPGVNDYAIAYASGVAAGSGMQMTGFAVAPSTTYSMQCRASASTGTLSMNMVMTWYTVNGTQISQTVQGFTAASGSYTAVAASNFTSPSNAASAILTIVNSATTASAQTIYVDSVQIEQGTAATAYNTPTWYPIFTGYVERWPQSWQYNGVRGVQDIECVDYFTFLANRALRDVYELDLRAYNPNFIYRLDEGSGASTFTDAMGKRGSASLVVASSPFISSGNSLQTTDNAPPGGDGSELTGGFLGANGPVVTTKLGSIISVNGVPTYGPTNGGALSIPPDPTTGNYGTPVSGSWTRIIAARAAIGTKTTNGPSVWAFVSRPSGFTGSQCEVAFTLNFYTSSGAATVMQGAVYNNAAGSVIQNFPFPSGVYQTDASTSVLVTDGDWHLYAIIYSSVSGNVALCCDGRVANYVPVGGDPRPVNNSTRTNGAAWADVIGWDISGLPNTAQQWVGDIAYAAELPVALTSGQWSNLYQSWRNAWAYNADHTTETSGTRYSRILSWIGSTNPANIDTGSQSYYGPATDIGGGTSPTDALTALQDVVDTELGQHFIGADGSVNFQNRTRRYSPSPTITFGENSAGGEIPYKNLQTDYDPTRIANFITISYQYGTGQVIVSDSTSITNYGQVDLTRTINSMDPNDAYYQAQHLLYQYKDPQTRIEAMPIDVGSHPSAFPTLLGLDLGTPVKVNRRPNNAPAISLTGFIEQISWEFGAISATCTLQVSNAVRELYGIFDSTTYGLFDSTLIFGY